MMRINKLTDYGIVVMTKIASIDANSTHTAKEMSEMTNIPLPTVTRLLKTLATEGLLTSQRGSQGGYNLAKLPSDISIASIIESFEGPIALIECATDECECTYEADCSTQKPWQKINDSVKTALEEMKLTDMITQEERLVKLDMNYGAEV